MPPISPPLLEAALGRPSTSPQSPADVGVVATARCGLAEFPSRACFGEGPDFACVIAGLGGALGGVGIVGVNVDDAVRLITPVGDEDPVEVFRRHGRAVLEALGERLAAEVGPVPVGEPVFHEGTLVSALLRTHAPREALVFSAELRLAGARAVPAFAYVVVDPKALP